MDKGQQSNETKTYKGILLEDLDKGVSMAHSAFFEKDEGIDHLKNLLSRDKSTLTPEQFKNISALNSVVNMNYQICNGGLDQYFFNSYHEEREPFHDQDVKQLDKDGQVQMLRKLQAFGKEVFPDHEPENERFGRMIDDFEKTQYVEPGDSWGDEDDYYGEYHGTPDSFHAFDERYFQINDYLETLIEGYAQYFDKVIDRQISRNSELKTFYFSFGTADYFPYKLGWVEVQAKNAIEACNMFASHYPRREGLLNCSFVYSEHEWKDTGMSKGGPGQVCHQVINDWGPYGKAQEHNQEKPLDDLMKEAKEKAAEKNASRQDPTRPHDAKGIDR